jgi:hypothetical protein
MRFSCCLILYLVIPFSSPAQESDTITVTEVSRIIHTLASDSFQGRGNFTNGLYHSARFIENEYRASGLQFLPGLESYRKPFLRSEPEETGEPGILDSALVLNNLVGIIPGKTRPAEAIIFSAHYDHLKKDDFAGRDPIFNGANDNASGTTALLLLARYYALRNDNARTLIFCAFAGEEMGLLGSKAFVEEIQPDRIVAMINMEMIGRSNYGSKTGFSLTGSYYSDLFQVMQKNLSGYPVTLFKERDYNQDLFARSDNYPFAQKGIPAHTIMSSDDSDPCYHHPCDEVSRIQLQHMTKLIRAIPVAVRTLVDGSVTPKRIKGLRLP